MYTRAQSLIHPSPFSETRRVYRNSHDSTVAALARHPARQCTAVARIAIVLACLTRHRATEQAGGAVIHEYSSGCGGCTKRLPRHIGNAIPTPAIGGSTTDVDRPKEDEAGIVAVCGALAVHESGVGGSKRGQRKPRSRRARARLDVAAKVSKHRCWAG